MKLAILVCSSYFVDRAMDMMTASGIDYYTRLDGAKGKGHGTEARLGTSVFGRTNSVLMIAFQDDAPREQLIRRIELENQRIERRSDHIRLFQIPLEMIV